MNDLTVITTASIALPASPFEGLHFIDFEWCDSADGATFERISPSHGVVVSRSAKGGREDAERAIAAARKAFDAGIWSRISGKERATVLLKVADLIEANVERMAILETLESGKPIAQARGEVSGAADLWRYAASLARTLHGDSHNSLGEQMLGVVLKEPIGVVSIITPWNFPFWILSQKLPFALAAGCTCVVKPSEMTPSTTVMLADLLVEAGLPAGVVNIVLGFGQPVGQVMAEHAQVDMVTFTGSTAVGKAIMAAASGTLKKVALELGGKNPQVIFPDTDLDSAADAADERGVRARRATHRDHRQLQRRQRVPPHQPSPEHQPAAGQRDHLLQRAAHPGDARRGERHAQDREPVRVGDPRVPGRPGGRA